MLIEPNALYCLRKLNELDAPLEFILDEIARLRGRFIKSAAARWQKPVAEVEDFARHYDEDRPRRQAEESARIDAEAADFEYEE